MEKKLYWMNQVNTDQYKIGISQNPKQRFKSLQASNPNKLIPYHFEKIPRNYDMEAEIHALFHEYNIHGEWFELDKKLLCRTISRLQRRNIELREKLKKERYNAFLFAINRNKVSSEIINNKEELEKDFYIEYRLNNFVDFTRIFSYDIFTKYSPEKVISSVLEYISLYSVYYKRTTTEIEELEYLKELLHMYLIDLKKKKEVKNKFRKITDYDNRLLGVRK